MNIVEVLEAYKPLIIAVGSSVIGIAALFFIIPIILRMMKKAKEEKLKDTGKDLIALLVILALAGLGILGVIKGINKVLPDELVGEKFSASSVSYEFVQTSLEDSVSALQLAA